MSKSKNILVINFENESCKTEKNFFKELKSDFSDEIYERYNIQNIDCKGLTLTKDFMNNPAKGLRKYFLNVDLRDRDLENFLYIAIDRDDELKFNNLLKGYDGIITCLKKMGVINNKTKTAFLLLPEHTSFEYVICMMFDTTSACKVKANLTFTTTAGSVIGKFLRIKEKWITQK
ncbi:hypothetical protein [[Acholeplasma] multilocale]|uniref:hypothetical protein n=1 Tax=[Acholeplasma] multilocale TaxID=264638 RepID=UPI00047E1336|nr:hypothetical protein [[Acholeplasma] multilocale]